MAKHAGKDLYKLLQIEQQASLKEIKAAYKKMALRLHPDRTKGDQHKTKQFRDISDAYKILSNDHKRRQYDLQHGFRYNKNRRNAPPKDYRKVYRPVVPNHVKSTFDHVRHYEMHYGQGMMDEAIQNATKEAERNGEDLNRYRSPLGKGFTFAGGTEETFNPYAKSRRRQKHESVWEYEEGTMFEGVNPEGQQTIHRRNEIVQDMNGRRQARKMKEAEQNQRKAGNGPFDHAAGSNGNVCVIS
mgnify:CR=1 FL=1